MKFKEHDKYIEINDITVCRNDSVSSHIIDDWGRHLFITIITAKEHGTFIFYQVAIDCMTKNGKNYSLLIAKSNNVEVSNSSNNEEESIKYSEKIGMPYLYLKFLLYEIYLH